MKQMFDEIIKFTHLYYNLINFLNARLKKTNNETSRPHHYGTP
jgi:hypothetical protein